MKLRLTRAARIRHEAGEVVEASPAEAGFLLSTGSAVRVIEEAPQTPEAEAKEPETPEAKAEAPETPEDAANKETRKEAAPKKEKKDTKK